MSRSLSYLRQGALAAALLGSLGFGAAQAFGSTAPPAGAALRTCPDRGFDYAYASCAIGCPGSQGYCAEGGICRCGQIP
ncbi:hypothetical protein [Longimicrobium sp.]|uniref:hypothetical protein n=1 Tax=Longimicrobium sp. TaxID=2029185 RepID=UPI002CF5B2CC|nr:hypothetical protein [Longimicrobium sp.]HSU17539.1 hypothetical protein [Longimicrobium sp.]